MILWWTGRYDSNGNKVYVWISTESFSTDTNSYSNS